MSAGNPLIDRPTTARLAAAPTKFERVSPNWLRHKFKAARIDEYLIEGATEECLSKIRGGVSSLRSHLSHLKLEHGLNTRKVRVGGQVFLQFDPNQTGRLSKSVMDPSQELEIIIHEGRLRRGLTTRYERKPKLREACLKHHGYACAVCKINFRKSYGEVGKSFIHVHHLDPLSTLKADHIVDPVKDLRPVCPNCHSMIHRHGLLRSIEEIKAVWSPEV